MSDNIRGLSGLQNIGNSCYFNSVIQALVSCDLLVEYLFKKKYSDGLKYNMAKLLAKKIRCDNGMDENSIVKISKSEITDLCKMTITNKLDELFSEMLEENCIIVPRSLKNMMGQLNNIFMGYNQNDAHETINFIFERIHDETKYENDIIIFDSVINISEFIEIKRKFDINNEMSIQKYQNYIQKNFDKYMEYKYRKFWLNFIKNNSSIITDIFTGILSSVVECSVCNYKSMTFEPFNIMSLSLQNNERTTLKDCIDNDYFNKEKLINDNKYKCDKCNILVDAMKKNNIYVFPKILIIHFKRFNQFSENIKKNNCDIEYPIKLFIKSKKYKLFSIIEHYGTINYGHYVTISKNKVNKNWYIYDDDNISHCKELTNKPYMLFYSSKN